MVGMSKVCKYKDNAFCVSEATRKKIIRRRGKIHCHRPKLRLR